MGNNGYRTDAKGILWELKQLGVDAFAADGKLQLVPGTKVPLELLRLVKAHKADILGEILAGSKEGMPMGLTDGFAIGVVVSGKRLAELGLRPHCKPQSAHTGDYILAPCPVCEKPRWISLYQVLHPAFTGLCAYCSARHGRSRRYARRQINTTELPIYLVSNAKRWARIVGWMQKHGIQDLAATPAGYRVYCKKCDAFTLLIVPHSCTVLTRCEHWPQYAEANATPPVEQQGSSLAASDDVQLMDRLITRLEQMSTEHTALRGAVDSLEKLLKERDAAILHKSEEALEYKRETQNYKVAFESIQKRTQFTPEQRKRAEAVLAVPGEGSLNGK